MEFHRSLQHSTIWWMLISAFCWMHFAMSELMVQMGIEPDIPNNTGCHAWCDSIQSKEAMTIIKKNMDQVCVCVCVASCRYLQLFDQWF